MHTEGACLAQVRGRGCLLSSLVQAPSQALDLAEASEILTLGTECQGVLQILAVKINNILMQSFRKLKLLQKRTMSKYQHFK